MFASQSVFLVSFPFDLMMLHGAACFVALMLLIKLHTQSPNVSEELAHILKYDIFLSSLLILIKLKFVFRNYGRSEGNFFVYHRKYMYIYLNSTFLSLWKTSPAYCES